MLSIDDIKLYEDSNKEFRISLLMVTNANNYKQVTQVYISPNIERKYHVVQLLIKKGKRFFYGLVVNPKKFIHTSNHLKIYCDMCISRFTALRYLNHICITGFTPVKKAEPQIKTISSELHQRVLKTFKRKPIAVAAIDNTWNMDLVDMSMFAKDNNGFKWMFTCIDIMSRYAWAAPLGSKHKENIVNAFKSIVESSLRKPVKIWVDEGKEFNNYEFKHYFKTLTGNDPDTHIYHTYGKCKTPILDRFHRTLKTNMWKRFTASSTHRWIDMLDDLLKEYNNRVHRMIQMTPIEASKKENESTLLRLQQCKVDSIMWQDPVFKVGDQVRLCKYKNIFAKGYTQNWTTEVFTINDIVKGKPIMYHVKDKSDEVIKGAFYKQELQLTTIVEIKEELVLHDENDSNVFEVDSVVGEKIMWHKIYYKIHWVGYPSSADTWECVKNLGSIADMIHEYRIIHEVDDDSAIGKLRKSNTISL
jgi:hypothetical protein